MFQTCVLNQKIQECAMLHELDFFFKTQWLGTSKLKKKFNHFSFKFYYFMQFDKCIHQKNSMKIFIWLFPILKKKNNMGLVNEGVMFIIITHFLIPIE